MMRGHPKERALATSPSLAATTAPFAAAGHPAQAPAGVERRIVTLDGLRGLMTILVIVSHYFGELPNGIRATTFGWIAVNMFFVLSGFLIGKLILDKKHHGNFFAVFYARRIFRLMPAYLLTVVALYGIIRLIGQPWTDEASLFPLASYLTFFQGFYFVSTGTIGAHWLAPTWTLTVEEHFYLLVPAAIVFTPRRYLVPVLVATAMASVALRIAIFGFEAASPMIAYATIAGRADILVCGVLAAILSRRTDIAWTRWMGAIRITPIAALLAVLALRLGSEVGFEILSPLILATGCAAFLLGIVHGAPEGKRFASPVLRFFGDTAIACI